MSASSFTVHQGTQGAYTLTGADYIAVESGGNTRVVTLNEVSSLLLGQTANDRVTDAVTCAVTHLNAGATTLDIDLTGNSGGLPLAWSSVSIDTDSIWSVGNPTRLTVPANVTRVQLTFSCTSVLLPSEVTKLFSIRKNGETGKGVAAGWESGEDGDSEKSVCLVSPILDVIPGDYFEVFVSDTNEGTASVYTHVSTYFCMQAVERT